MTDANKANKGLELRLLGPIEVWQDGERKSLPRSKKTRALLAYLAVTGRAHSRNRLCELFWDVTDDPRGALRWSLSRLRKVVDAGERRIDADRERVAFTPKQASVDAVELVTAVRNGVSKATTDHLEWIAGRARGEFLEGLELPDFYEFQAWCVAQREQAREARCGVLAELVQRLRDEPRRALVHARSRVHADSLSVEARVELLDLLLRAGRADEAEKQFDMSKRLFREVGAAGLNELEAAWLHLRNAAAIEAPAAVVAPPAAKPAPAPPQQPSAPPASDLDFVGREQERKRLRSLLQESQARGSQRVVLITGEPGAGKSALVRMLVDAAGELAAAVRTGRAYEAESTRPYGPWVDALRGDLPALPEAAPGGALVSRDAWFAAVADAVATTAAQRGAVLVLDDIQWLDRDSAELLHFVARTNRQRPILIALVARSGELADNEHALRALRSLRRELRIEELNLPPLSAAEVAALVAPYVDGDSDYIYDACAGNPLYALELARAAAAGVREPSRSLIELVRERIERLPAHAADVLRWGSVLGHTVSLSRLQSLSSLSFDELVDAAERLEQHTLLRTEPKAGADAYVFAHDVVREAVYGELSHPRRRLMHQQVARMLADNADSAALATEVAHHAGLAGDAMLGVRACIDAGLQSLRMFANGDAEALAKRGLRLVEDLDASARVGSTLELLHVLYTARSPDPEQAAARIRPLIEQALDAGETTAARLGFQMLSYLRWESGSMIAAHDNIMRAERISRSADPAERTVALSQAAKCLVLLERDLALAEAFLLEADALSGRIGDSPSAMRFAAGMMHEHRGELDEALEAYRDARQLGRQQGDQLAEFCAIEHLMMLELDRDHHDRALELAVDLNELGARVRAGAEAACGRALYNLARRYSGHAEAGDALDEAIDALRKADSKYRLAYVLTRLARLELRGGHHEVAGSRARDGLQVATAIGRASEIALAHTLLVECAGAAGDADGAAEHVEALTQLRDRELSAAARAAVEAALAS